MVIPNPFLNTRYTESVSTPNSMRLTAPRDLRSGKNITSLRAESLGSRSMSIESIRSLRAR